MPTLEEVASWTLDQIRAQIHQLLPKGWKFDLQQHTDHWRAFYRTEADVEVWADRHYDQRIMLLNAWGWLWQQRDPKKVHPAWRPKPGRQLIPVVHPASQAPDPEDLDPREVASVYSESDRRRQR